MVATEASSSVPAGPVTARWETQDKQGSDVGEYPAAGEGGREGRDNAHCISLYWEGDLRNLSYFLNKIKELEFYNCHPTEDKE